jgi:hypothetical protein
MTPPLALRTVEPPAIGSGHNFSTLNSSREQVGCNEINSCSRDTSKVHPGPVLLSRIGAWGIRLAAWDSLRGSVKSLFHLGRRSRLEASILRSRICADSGSRRAESCAVRCHCAPCLERGGQPKLWLPAGPISSEYRDRYHHRAPIIEYIPPDLRLSSSSGSGRGTRHPKTPDLG